MLSELFLLHDESELNRHIVAPAFQFVYLEGPVTVHMPQPGLEIF